MYPSNDIMATSRRRSVAARTQEHCEARNISVQCTATSTFYAYSSIRWQMTHVIFVHEFLGYIGHMVHRPLVLHHCDLGQFPQRMM